MGSKLALAAAVIALATAGTARADDAAALLKRGLGLYKQGKYAEAATVIAKAYELDPKPETLFPLAQAERLAGDCKAAASHYKQVLAQISDLNVAKLVQQNLALCEPPAPAQAVTCPAPETKPEPAPPPAPPKIVTKTVVREVSRSDRLSVVLAGAGALALGAAGGLAIASSSTSDAADRAGSLSSHDTLASRADAERDAALVTAGVGVAVLGYATLRWLVHHDTASATDVAIVPLTGGGAFAVTTRW